MKVIECRGAPRDIGCQCGEALREEIAEHLELIPRRGVDKEDGRMKDALDSLFRNAPAVLEEMAGLAEGANVSIAEIHRINVPINVEELSAKESASGPSTCSNVAFVGGPDGPILGKNNDGTGIRRPVYAKKVLPVQGIPHVAFPFAGWVGTASGMNAEGLSIGSSSVGSVLQRSNRHVPLRFWSYLAMQRCRTVGEYVEAMTERPLRGKGFSLLAVDRDGTAVSLEAPSPLVQVRRAEGRAMMNCVNCFQLPALAGLDRRTPEGKAHALARIRLFERECKRGGVFDLDRMKALLRHHGGSHGSPSVCRHGQEQDAAETEYSYICLPDRGEVLYLEGFPCENEYVRISI